MQSGVILDYEDRRQYQFQVLVQNPDQNSGPYETNQTANVTINVLDGMPLVMFALI